MFVYLFLRELVPSEPWAATVGALAVAFQPLFGFIGSGVTPDTLSSRPRPRCSGRSRARSGTASPRGAAP